MNSIQDIDINSVSIENDPDYEALGWGKNESAVNYIALIPYLIKAIQELNSRIEALESAQNLSPPIVNGE